MGRELALALRPKLAIQTCLTRPRTGIIAARANHGVAQTLSASLNGRKILTIANAVASLSIVWVSDISEGSTSRRIS